ncbi:hypothetical protein ATC03_15105 [Agromyces aureus]|uniref:DUF4190 domain-containing protein n=1 Tax=Agromyces aureus TaxID=453304 RepID=A0A191WHR1_9MICO|nr:hypothetical protein ATC03_15105 [Agromyces aureus]
MPLLHAFEPTRCAHRVRYSIEETTVTDPNVPSSPSGDTPDIPTAPAAPVPPAPPAPPVYSTPPAAPPAPSVPAYGTTAPAYDASAPAYGAPTPAKTNVLAIVSLVASLVGFFTGIGFLVGIVCGHIGISQIKKTGEQGRGMAVAGLVIGYIGLVLSIILTIVFIVLFAIAASYGGSTYSY